MDTGDNTSYNSEFSRIQNLLKKGADVNTKDGIGQTFLMIASLRGNTRLVTFLIKNGADINAVDDYGTTALMNAAECGHLSVVKKLIKHGADINAANVGGQSALILACFYNHNNIARFLLKQGAKTDEKSSDINLLLFCITLIGHVSQLKLLLQYGIDINMRFHTLKGADKTTPLMIACENGHLNLVKLLLQNGAEIDSKDSEGKTALMYAENKYIAKYLLANGADINARDNADKNAFLWACLNGNADTAEFFIKKRFDINETFSIGTRQFSILMLTALANQPVTVKFLLEHKVEFTKTDFDILKKNKSYNEEELKKSGVYQLLNDALYQNKLGHG